MVSAGVLLVIAAAPPLVRPAAAEGGKFRAREVERAARPLYQRLAEHDRYTWNHSRRVAVYAREVARALGHSAGEAQRISTAALLHDIGKLGVDKALINNRSAHLSEPQMARMRAHTVIGRALLGNGALRDVRDGASFHHERFDGKGYPFGLRGVQIPHSARIISVVDAFDAMTSNRSYSRAMGLERAVGELQKGSGSHFDPQVVDAFIRLLRDNGSVQRMFRWGQSDDSHR